MHESEAEALEEAKKHWAEFLREGWLPDGVFSKSLEPGGAMRRNLDEGWLTGGIYRLMVEDCVEINQ